MALKGFRGGRFGGLDRGTAVLGAKRVIVTDKLEIIDHALAKQHGIEGTHFQSKMEAKRWVALNVIQRAGRIRNLQRQVRYPLHVVNPQGLKVRIGVYVADFVYEERGARIPDNLLTAAEEWVEIVEDAKGHIEDLYKWKRAHWEAEYGKTLHEWKGQR